MSLIVHPLPERRYWVIQPLFKSDETKRTSFEEVWEFDIKNNSIAIEYEKIDGINGLDFNTAIKKYKKAYPELIEHKNIIPKWFSYLWLFYKEIKIGDIIFAKKYQTTPIVILGKGIVTKAAYHDNIRSFERIGSQKYSHFLDVDWLTTGEFNLGNTVLANSFFYEIDYQKYNSLNMVVEGHQKEATNLQLNLENEIENYIIENFDIVFDNKLNLFARQYVTTDAGIIDILATDKATGDYIVIELKKDQGEDQVVGQTLRYIGWVRKHLCKADQNVRGIIIAQSVSIKLSYAVGEILHIDAMIYK